MLASVSSFQNFTKLLSEKNNKEKGNAFEQLVYAYFKLEPKYSFYDEVWPFSDVPSLVLEELKLPSQDIGIDLIAKMGDEYHAIQCKYHQDNSQSVTFKEVSTFISLLESNTKITQGYICSTADITSRVFNKLNTKPINLLLNDTWAELDETFFERLKAFFEGKKPKGLLSYKPKDHQKKALKNAHDYFLKQKNSRGKLIFPCGAGKSLTGYWMTKELASKKTIIAVPSLSLVKQTLEVYLREVVAKKRSVKWLCICSDEGIGKDDDVVYFTENIGVPCQTNPEYIKKWLVENRDEEIFIFTTYQSGRIIAEISKELELTFDLGIFDEAHKTVGANKKLFSHLLFEENISISKRIFMTATERFYKGSKDDIISMDDEDIYGDTFAQMSFKEAIETGLLTDYKVITIEIQKSEIAEFIRENNLVQLNDKWKKETEARSMASMLALRKAMKMFPIKNAVSFHSSIEKAVRNKELQQYITDTYDYQPIDTFTVSGKQATSKRNSIVQEFARSEHSLITNARCLTEGVDVPNIDCIIFSDPRKSKVDIVQALGRALRKKNGKDWGYVILPIIYDDTTQEIDNENFQEILSIVRGLASNDERIVEFFKDNEQTNNNKETKDGQFHLEVFSDYMDASELANQLQIKLWDKLSRFSWLPFIEAREFVRGLKLNNIAEWKNYKKFHKLPYNIPNSPSDCYLNKGWVNWGDWLGNNNIKRGSEEWQSFKNAREFAQKLKLNSWEQWLNYKDLPINIPRYPNQIFPDEYEGIQDWLGIEIESFLLFEEARKIVHSWNLKSRTEWIEISKNPKFPSNIPKWPNVKYKDQGWVDFKDWLGLRTSDFNQIRTKASELKLTSRHEWYDYILKNNLQDIFPLHPQRKFKNKGWINWQDWLGNTQDIKSPINYLPFIEARETVRKLQLKTVKDWERFHKEVNENMGLPEFPHRTYKEFLSFGDWIGTVIKTRYLNYHEAEKISNSLQLKSVKDWYDYVKTNKLTERVPVHPQKVYKYDGWIDWNKWLGNNKSSWGKIEWLDFNDARSFVQSLNFKNETEWINYTNSVEFPENLPKQPRNKYKSQGWKGMTDWLGIKKQITGNYLDFDKARDFAQKLKLKSAKEWFIFTKSNNLPSNIPASPEKVYNSKGWLSWGDWLGKTPGWDGNYLNFNDFIKYIRIHDIQSKKEWEKHTQSMDFPFFLPKKPEAKYLEWIGWNDLLECND
jgi:superfamily II DNA or RNA helicase